MEDLRVPKRKVAVEVLLPGGQSRRVSLFLAEAAADHDGPELPADFVNGPPRFVPVVDEASGAITFLNLASVAVVRVPRALDAEEDPFEVPVEHQVAIALLDGTVLQGIVSYVRPEDRARLGDLLNEPPPFVRLVEAETVALVNKRHVARVVIVRS